MFEALQRLFTAPIWDAAERSMQALGPVGFGSSGYSVEILHVCVIYDQKHFELLHLLVIYFTHI